ncbi:MAG: SURF1 family protein [Nitrosomonas sp.]|jgi:surfeit locus 1 family protein|nr:SURF1 family protein [Nitrosomonas sp.]MBP7112659.1 SURF1 family protein [Nitrosomonas sp.]
MVAFGYRFEPKIWAIIVTLIFALIFIELGKWQLSRADEKDARYELLDQYSKQPAIKLPDTSVKLEEFLYREIEVEGEFQTEHTIFLDNKTYHGRAGYHIITPLKIASSQLSVVINRGWIATGNDRSILPKITEIKEKVRIIGTVVSPEIKSFTLSDENPISVVWNNFNLQQYQKATGLELQPLLVLQKDKMDDGLIRDWTKPNSGASKNTGYAVQWFSLAVTTIIIFLALNVKRKSSKIK